MKKKFTTMVLLILISFNISLFTQDAAASTISNDTKYIIIIDLYSFTLSVIDKETKEYIKTYPIAIGKKDTPSPIGIWQVKSKALMKGPFGGYWLGLNAPWDTFGIHGTSNPGSIGSMASNGCIRLYNYNIKELFDMIEYDTSVIISGGPNWRFSPYNRIIKPNYKGTDVYHVQRILNALGYYDHPADGIYGYSLELAVKKYRADNNLPITSDIDEEFFESIGCEKFE